MFERVYELLPSDVGGAGTMKPRSLLNCLQDTADMAVKELDADTQSVLNRGYAWVLVHGSMYINRWATLGERFTVRTWHNVNDGLYIFRAFDLRDSCGQPLMEGRTSWILIDLARGRPVKPKQHLPEIFISDGNTNPNVCGEFINLPKDSESVCEVKNFDVRTHDLDANDHVNNAAYIEWAVEASKFAISKKLLGWEVNYRKSAHYGDTITVKNNYECRDGMEVVTASMSAADIFLCTVRTFWQGDVN